MKKFENLRVREFASWLLLAVLPILSPISSHSQIRPKDYPPATNPADGDILVLTQNPGATNESTRKITLTALGAKIGGGGGSNAIPTLNGKGTNTQLQTPGLQLPNLTNGSHYGSAYWYDASGQARALFDNGEGWTFWDTLENQWFFTTNEIYGSRVIRALDLAVANDWANTLWVSPKGNDATAIIGRSDKPWASFSNACARVTNNQTILIMPGRYTNLMARQATFQMGESNKCYWLHRVTNVNVLGIGQPTLYMTGQVSGLVLGYCDGVKIKGLTFEGIRETNPVLSLAAVAQSTFGHIETYASTNLVFEDLSLLNGSDFGIMHGIYSALYGTVGDEPGHIVRRCTARNFGNWMTNQLRYDGAGIASGCWIIEDSQFEESAVGVEIYPWASPSAIWNKARISRCRFKNMIRNAIWGQEFRQSLFDGNTFEQTPGYNRGGTNPLPTVASVHAGTFSGLEISGSHIDGYASAWDFEATHTNIVLRNNIVTNCAARFGSFSSGVVQDETLPVTTTGMGKVVDGAGLLWPNDNSFSYSSGLPAWILAPAAGTTNRQALTLGGPTDLGFGLFWDDYDGTAWRTLSLYDTLGPDWSGSMANFRSKTNFAQEFVASGIYHGNGSGLSNIVASGSSNLTDSGFTVLLNGNLQASNSISASNVYAAELSVSTLNVGMLNATNYGTPTNLATAAAQTIALNQDSTVCITNVVAGAVNVWFTNAMNRKWFVLRCKADGSARTLSFTNASGLTLNVANTNAFSVTTLPQVPIAAGKIATVIGRVWVIAGVTNVDLFGSVQQ